MPYTVPTLTEAEQFLVALFKSLFPDRNVGSKRSYHRRRAKILAAAATELHAHIDSSLKDVMPDTATGAHADRWGGIVGVIRKGATGARKSAALRVRGTLAAAITVGDQLTHAASGFVFQITESAVIPAALFIDVDIAAVDTGAATRLTAGEVLEFVSTPAGLETEAVLVLDIDEDGFDSEKDDPYRNRYLATFSQPASGGNQADYVKWALEFAGVTAAFCYPNRSGLGTVDVAALHTGSGSARVLTGGEVADLLDYLQTKAPAHLAGENGALRILTTVIESKNIDIKITTNGDAAYEFDWDDTTPPIVAAWTAATRTMQFTLARPPSMKAGDRICIHGIASSQKGEVNIIESLVSTDSVVLQNDPLVAPAATDTVYAGGPVTESIRNAVLAHINGEVLYAGKDGPVSDADVDSTVNLRVLADGIGTANPAGLYGTWSGSLVLAILQKIATYQRGVRNAQVITPATDQDATDYTTPDDFQIGLIVPGEVLIRSA